MKISPIFYALASVLIFASIAGANQIERISIEKGVYNAPGMSPEYEICIDVGGQDIKSASFSCEGSGWGDLSYDIDWDEWCFEDESDSIDFFLAYPNGDFEFSVTFNNDEVRDYTVAFNNTIPVQTPVITYPVHMQTNVEKEPTFMWDAVVDPTINAIWAWIDNPVTDEEIWDPDEPFFDMTMVSLDSPIYLPDGWLTFGLDFIDADEFTIYDPVTADEISALTVAYNSSGVTFSTVPEPATIAMIAAGALSMAGVVRKRLA